MTDAPLTPAETRRLDALANALIPASGSHLSASAAGVFGALLPDALGYAPEVLPLCRDALAAVGDGTVWDLRSADPALFERFAETVAAIYFMSPEVRAAVGFPGRTAVPARADPAAMEDLLAPVFDGDFAPRAI